jgi:hypothetical protein
VVFKMLVFFTAQPFDPADSPREIYHGFDMFLQMVSSWQMKTSHVLHKFFRFDHIFLCVIIFYSTNILTKEQEV